MSRNPVKQGYIAGHGTQRSTTPGTLEQMDLSSSAKRNNPTRNSSINLLNPASSNKAYLDTQADQRRGNEEGSGRF